MVRDAMMQIDRGRIAEVTARAGAEWVRRRAGEIGPDGDRIALVSFNTNPLSQPGDVSVDIGSNWENGATNRATRMWRMSMRLASATVTVDGRPIVRDGRILWESIRAAVAARGDEACVSLWARSPFVPFGKNPRQRR